MQLEYTVEGVSAVISSTKTSLTVEARASLNTFCNDNYQCLSSFCDSFSKKCMIEPWNAVSSGDCRAALVPKPSFGRFSFFKKPNFHQKSAQFGFRIPSISIPIVCIPTPCTYYTLVLPESLKDRFQMTNNPSGLIYTFNINPKFGICGKNMNALQPFLDPPGNIQQLLSCTFGLNIGISRLNSNVLSSACNTLSSNLKGDRLTYAFVDFNKLGDSVAMKLLNRATANDMNAKLEVARRVSQSQHALVEPSKNQCYPYFLFAWLYVLATNLMEDLVWSLLLVSIANPAS
jgi:hypothetical protein